MSDSASTTPDIKPRSRDVTDGLERAATEEREARARAIAHRERVRREGRVAQAVLTGAEIVRDRLAVSVHAAAEARTAVEQSRRGS